jgi:predicted ester cyclase
VCTGRALADVDVKDHAELLEALEAAVDRGGVEATAGEPRGDLVGCVAKRNARFSRFCHRRDSAITGALTDGNHGRRRMSSEESKELIQRYIQAVDDNHTSDWSVLDDYIAEDFVAHNPPIPGVSLDRDGMKQAAETFRVAAPGRHEIKMQVAEGDLVVSHIVGRGVHEGELMGIPATNREVETDGIVIHRIRGGKIVEYWSVVDVASVLQQVGALPGPPD